MKILFLLPPSEWKNPLNNYKEEVLSFNFEKPISIAENATEKDLKCKWSRFEEAISLNKNIWKKDTIEAIGRYSGVMYSAIWYDSMTNNWKKYFDNNFMILSGLYGLLKPKDLIVNYKLPVETKGLYDYWWDIIPDNIASLEVDYIVNLLPISYAKLLGLWTNCSKHKKKLDKIISSWKKIININFLKEDWKKISHWVKKIKGEWIKSICEKWASSINDFWWKILDNWNIIDVNIIYKL